MEPSGGQLPTGTVTFLFSDIEDSTRLVEKLDTSAFRELIEQHHRLMRRAFADHGGIERGTQGDSFLAVFPKAPSAVAAAVKAQRSVAEAVWPGESEVQVRMGLHSGNAISGGDDYIGLDINRAARIASAAHGGQVLISDSTRALSEDNLPSGVTVRDVGVHRLKGIERPERLYQLVVEEMRSDFPPPRAAGPGVSRLPSRLTSFVGRQTDLVSVRSLLEGSRLVTLIGPGGAGKTSLATELARTLEDSFAGGAWFVDLAPLDDSDFVASTIARRLGISEQAGISSLKAIEAHLASRQLLLVLDNFEHVLAAAELVTAMLNAAPGLTVLVTSRRPLEVYGEQEYAVPPLPLPDPTWADAERISTSDAVALFVERARIARPGFSVTEDNASSIAQICARLDGLPLAIELAASRIRILTPEEILSRLEERHSVLTERGRMQPRRHQTLEAAIDWSFDLAAPVEQDLLVRLSFFAGGFTYEAAEAVCNPHQELGIDTLDGVESLVVQSLLQHKEIHGESRFEMLETVRDYGRTRLFSADHLEQLTRRHLEFFTGLVEGVELKLLGPEQGRWLDRIEADHANLRLALRNAVDTGEDEAGLRLASAIWRFWLQRGYLLEGRSWLEELLEMNPGVASLERARGFVALGGLTFWLFDSNKTEAAYESARGIFGEIGDDEGRAEAIFNLAYVPAMRNQLSDARGRFEASLEVAREVGLPHLIARNQIMLGILAVSTGDPSSAESYFEQAVRFFGQSGDRFHVAWATRGLGSARFALGQIDEARSAYLQGLRLYSEVRNLPGIGQSLREISGFESSQGNHIAAMRLAGATAALRETIGVSAPIPDIIQIDVEGDARKAIGDGAAEDAFEEGRQLAVEEAVAFAVSVLA